MTTVAIAIATAILAAILTWIYGKAIFLKNAVPRADYESLQGKLMQLEAQEEMQKTLLHATEKYKAEAEARAQHLQEMLTSEGKLLSTSLAECSAAREHLADVAAARDIAIGNATAHAKELQTAQQEVARLSNENKSALEKLEAQREFIAGVKADMEREFRLIANMSLDENSRKLSDQQKEKLESTLQPFREQIDAFRKQVDEKFTAEVADRNTLKGELSKVFALTNSLTDQTNKLTNALTTNTKSQGNFGEGILETILTNAGMLEGVHYEKQYNTTNEDGQQIIPDIVLHCPDGYSLVVDSKVSLTHYMRYCNEPLTPEGEKMVRKEIWNSFKSHIDGLSGKKYESIARCADFVLMFAPVESAFTVAAQHDADIRNYAFQKKVFLVTPSNLLLVVKMIGDLWQKDRVNKDAHAMAERAKALYDKACSFLTSFTQMGASLEKAQTQYREATGQLTGHGGIVRQGELLQKLIAKPDSKKIPASLLAEAQAAMPSLLDTSEGSMQG